MSTTAIAVDAIGTQVRDHEGVRTIMIEYRAIDRAIGGGCRHIKTGASGCVGKGMGCTYGLKINGHDYLSGVIGDVEGGQIVSAPVNQAGKAAAIGTLPALYSLRRRDIERDGGLWVVSGWLL